jgi:hypothetical protein
VDERAHAERAAAREHLGVTLERDLEQAEEGPRLAFVRCVGWRGAVSSDLFAAGPLARRARASTRAVGEDREGKPRARSNATPGARPSLFEEGGASAPFSGVKYASMSLRSTERSCCFTDDASAPPSPAPFDASALSSRSRSFRSFSRFDAPARAPPGPLAPTPGPAMCPEV